MARTTAEEVASFFVRFCAQHGDPITNLHLQKYLYYAQGWFLAFYGEPLFEDRLEAWVHGPVQPGQYRRFQEWRWAPIQPSEGSECPDLCGQVSDHIEEVHSAYGHFSAWDLERMSHAETPWLEARAGIPDDELSNAGISPESMRRYFLGRLE